MAGPLGTISELRAQLDGCKVSSRELTDAALAVTSLVTPGGASAATFNLSLVAAGVAQTYPAASGTTLP